jgi:cysteine dioxygenase
MTFIEKIHQIDRLYSEQKDNIKGPAEFKAILKDFSFCKEEMEGDLLYPEELPYGRKCIFRSSNFEVIVMNWKPQQQSNIHNHGNSFGCVYAVSGNANNVLYNDDLDQLGCIPLINHSIAEVPKKIFHVIENKHDEYAVSLHFYAPPMCGMRVIDASDKAKSFFVKNDQGAWNPAPDEILPESE